MRHLRDIRRDDTDGRTDGRTDRPSFSDAMTHPKRSWKDIITLISFYARVLRSGISMAFATLLAAFKEESDSSISGSREVFLASLGHRLNLKVNVLAVVMVVE